jgi:hypothetical protein
VLGVGLVGEYPGMDVWVQRLDASAEDLGEAGDVLDRRDRYSEATDVRCGRACRHDLNAGLVQAADQFVQAGLVGDADEGALDLDAAHGIVTFLPVIVQPSRAIRPT